MNYKKAIHKINQNKKLYSNREIIKKQYTWKNQEIKFLEILGGAQVVKISIIIIGYNSSGCLQKLLQSLNQLIINNELIEVIYVDDGSLDNSVQIFKDFRLMIKIWKILKFFSQTGFD